MSPRSEKNLMGVHHSLVAVVRRAEELLEPPLGFIVTEGLRTKERQAELVKAGASQTMNSRHLIGQAVDLAATVNGEVLWTYNLYPKLNDAMQKAAKEIGVVVTWGGNFPRFKDGVHFQIEPDRQVT